MFQKFEWKEKVKFRMVGSDIAQNKDKDDDFVKRIKKTMETRCALDHFTKLVAKLLEKKSCSGVGI